LFTNKIAVTVSPQVRLRIVSRLKRGFQPNATHATHGANSRIYEHTNLRNVRNITKWRHYWIGQSQPSETTAYMPLARCLWQTRAKLLKLNLIDLRHSSPWSATLSWWWGLCTDDPDDL